MKNKKYSIKKLSTGIISIIIGIGTMKVGIANAQMESNNKVVIDEKGVIPDVEPIPPENVIEEPIRKPPIKSEEKPSTKPTEKPVEKSLKESSEKPSIKPAPKPTEKPVEKSLKESSEKPSIKPAPKPTEKPVEKSLKVSSEKPIEKLSAKPTEQPPGNPIEKSTTNTLETNSKVEIKNDVLVGNLSGREIKVSFKKGSVSFSKFTIVERIKIGSKDLEERTKIVIPEKIENKEDNELSETNSIKDEKQLKILPKTGISVNSFISTGFILIIVASIIRKKKNHI